MADRATDRLLVSMNDIAALAGVQRPVVSMWRSRSAGSAHPFPDPVMAVHGRFRFDAAEVAAWLSVTGRGNNPDAAADAAVVGVPSELVGHDDERLGDGLAAMLCLIVLGGQPLATSVGDGLVAVAERLDPDDALLLSEVRGLGVQAPLFAAWADAAADSAFSAERAFDLVVERRLAGSASSAGSQAVSRSAHSSAAVLAPALHRLVARLMRGLASDVCGDLPRYVDATPGGSELMMSVLRHGDGAAEVDTTATVVLTGADRDARRARRRMVVHGVHPAPVVDGQPLLSGPGVHLLQLTADADAGRLLTAVDDLQLQLDDAQRAVVVAPASVLCDRLTDRELDRQRDHLLRLDRVRSVVRLPERLVPAHPRERLGLWVLGPAHADVRVDMRWTSVTDLSDKAPSDAVIDDLVSDLLAAMGDQAMVRSHAFRFARLRQTAAMLAGRRALVGVGVVAGQVDRTAAADRAVMLEQLRAAATDDGTADPLGDLAIQPMAGDLVDPRVTITSAVERGSVKVLPGNRVQLDRLPAGRVPVVTTIDLQRDVPGAQRFVDALALEASYPAASRTQPGDVIFCTSPRPRAVVDTEGGTVVVYPARVLRVTDPIASGLVPQAVATDINLLPLAARTWRAWSVRLVPSGQVPAVTAALSQLNDAERRARERAAQLHHITDLVVQGVASRALALVPMHDDGHESKSRS